MELTNDQIKKVLLGELKFNQLGFSMMVTRLKGIYGKTPTPEALQSCSREISTFIDKYESIMTQDIETISRL